ncbi:MAG: cytochrome c oxidase subunit II [Rhodospirillaceae bacterium]|nr:cytochrome c oxidase subunit II [Rhodospirillaceae bacterium]
MTARILGFLSLVSSTLLAWAAAAQQDMPTPSFPKEWQLNLQTPVTPVARMIYDFHTELLWITTAISVFVLILLLICIFRFNEKANPVPSKTAHNTTIEIVWTVVPIIILAAIAFPSYRLLFFMDRTTEAEMTIKVIGNQWFWSYEYPDQEISFDSLALPDDQIDASKGQHRLFEVDKHVVLPVDTTIRVLFTANDVLHAWTIPAFGVKLDNMPGRINETWMKVEQEGRYYGQCSELCGVDHSYMPIVVDIVSKEKFQEWVEKEKQAAQTPAATQLALAR